VASANSNSAKGYVPIRVPATANPPIVIPAFLNIELVNPADFLLVANLLAAENNLVTPVFAGLPTMALWTVIDSPAFLIIFSGVNLVNVCFPISLNFVIPNAVCLFPSLEIGVVINFFPAFWIISLVRIPVLVILPAPAVLAAVPPAKAALPKPRVAKVAPSATVVFGVSYNS